MDVRDILTIELIESDTEVKSKEELFRAAAKKLYHHGYVVEAYDQQLLKREKSFPTGLATKTVDVAIPHTDADYVKKPFIYVFKLKNNLSFNQMGTFPEEHILVYPKFVFILGFNKNDLQLHILQTLMKLFSDEEIMTALVGEQKRQGLFDLLEQHLEVKGEN